LQLTPNDIPNEELAKAFTILLRIIEESNRENEKMKEEMQYLSISSFSLEEAWLRRFWKSQFDSLVQCNAPNKMM